jgi:repressor LexA
MIGAVRVFQCPDCQSQWRRQSLTKRQREVFDFVERTIHGKGYSPSWEEIAAEFGFASLATVAEHVDNLQRKGWLTRRYNEARSLQIVEEGR